MHNLHEADFDYQKLTSYTKVYLLRPVLLDCLLKKPNTTFCPPKCWNLENLALLSPIAYI